MRWLRAGPPLPPGKTVLYSVGLLLLTLIELRELFSFGGRSCAVGCSTAHARSWPLGQPPVGTLLRPCLDHRAPRNRRRPDKGQPRQQEQIRITDEYGGRDPYHG